jgi:N-acetylated-alpha-linked acidic dipeptidase
MKRRAVLAWLVAASVLTLCAQTAMPPPAQAAAPSISGFFDPAAEAALERQFLAVPDPKLAEEHLRILTAEPHIAGSPEDRKTAEYVAKKYREAGLETEIVEYKVWFNYPAEISVDVLYPKMLRTHLPTPEHVEGDPYQDDPRVVTAYNGFSPSGEAEADLVYANFGRPEDFKKLEELKVDVKGKIVIVRYGSNFRGVKSYVAQQHGAAGVIIYSDPIDDGYFKGDKYPQGPWRPDSGVQRGSILYMFKYPGDPTTPGVASVPSLPDSQRVPPEKAESLPKVPTTPLSYGDARSLLENLGGPQSPRDWQGALPFTYHVGPGPVRVRMRLKQDYAYRTIWNVIGKIKGSELPEQWVIAGNHRDAWVYGAVDPNSGTTSQLEAVHGLGELLRSGWRPRRTIVICSWDAEEQGLIGSTEWVEEHAQELSNAVAYFNLDVAVAGPSFGASSVPSLKQFIRDVTKAVPSAKGGMLYDVWKQEKENEAAKANPMDLSGRRAPAASSKTDVSVGDLGSGSDYTSFLQHQGVPSADMSSSGNYGVYHSVFDNFQWYKKFADPDFLYSQEISRVYGLEVLRMSEADVLPYDYETYGKEISEYLEAAQKKSATAFGDQAPAFQLAQGAAERFTLAGTAVAAVQRDPKANRAQLNGLLSQTERALLLPNGLPNRPWFRHSVYAPGEYTGYAAVVIPGVNEAIDAGDRPRATAELLHLTEALNRAAALLESYH